MSRSREFSRAPIRVRVVLYSELGMVEGEVDNLSMSGMLVKASARLPIGTACRLFLTLGSEPQPISVSATGVVRRHASNGLGVSFDELLQDTFEHLARLMLLNSDDRIRSNMSWTAT